MSELRKQTICLPHSSDFDRIVSTRKLTVEVPADASPDAFITVAVDDIYGTTAFMLPPFATGNISAAFDRAPTPRQLVGTLGC